MLEFLNMKTTKCKKKFGKHIHEHIANMKVPSNPSSMCACRIPITQLLLLRRNIRGNSMWKLYKGGANEHHEQDRTNNCLFLLL